MEVFTEPRFHCEPDNWFVSCDQRREFLVIRFFVSDKIQVGERFMLAPVSRSEQVRSFLLGEALSTDILEFSHVAA